MKNHKKKAKINDQDSITQNVVEQTQMFVFATHEYKYVVLIVITMASSNMH